MTDPPHDPVAEQQVLGAMLSSSERVARAKAMLTVADFYEPRHQRIFDAIVRVYDDGMFDAASSWVAISDATRAGGHEPVPVADIFDMIGMVGWPEASVQIVIRLSVARRVFGGACEVRDEALKAVLGPSELVDYAASTFAGIEVPDLDKRRLANVQTFVDFVAGVDARPEPWVIPGLLRRGWRAVVVATEGAGKSVVLRTLAGAAAAGVHPFEHGQIPSIAALVIDLENPRDVIASSLAVINQKAAKEPGFDPHAALIDSRPGGMDIRSRAGRLDLEALVVKLQPDLVCIGPVYKMYRAVRGETDEQAAGEAMAVLDDLRSRYGFALALEHHAPKGSMGTRDILPHGTALWLRWPELGIKLTTSERGHGSLDVGRWRPDRVTCTWPVRLDRGGPGAWPWVGSYSERMEHAP